MSVELYGRVMWDEIRYRKNMTDKIKLVIGPLHRLRCIPQPRLRGIYRLCSDPEIDLKSPNDFDALAKEWEHCVAAETPFRILPEPPTYKLFMELKALHEKVVKEVPSIGFPGEQCLLHRARVAREQEDIPELRKQLAWLMSLARKHCARGGDLRREVESAAQRITEMMTHVEETGPQLRGQVDTSRPMLIRTDLRRNRWL